MLKMSIKGTLFSMSIQNGSVIYKNKEG